MLHTTRVIAPTGFLLALAACAPVGGLNLPSEPSAARPAKYRAMVLSTVSSGLQVGSQSNVQPQTQIGANTQQLFVFVFGNNNVVTVDQANLMPFLNLNWVNQSMGQTQVAGDVTATSNSGALQWDPGSLTSLMGQAPAASAAPGVAPPPTTVPSPTPSPTVWCTAPTPSPTPPAPAILATPGPTAVPTPAPAPTPTPTATATPAPSPTPSADTMASDQQATAAALAALTGLTFPEGATP